MMHKIFLKDVKKFWKIASRDTTYVQQQSLKNYTKIRENNSKNCKKQNFSIMNFLIEITHSKDTHQCRYELSESINSETNTKIYSNKITIFKLKGSLASRPKDLITYEERNLDYHHIWITQLKYSKKTVS